MLWLLTLTLTGIARYLNLKLTEEIEAMSAGLVACIGLFLSLFFAPIFIKLALLTILLTLPKSISN
jgi:hypothetical protein